MENKITYAYIETTNHCNLQCTFCNRNQVIGKLRHMSIDEFKSILCQIKDYPISQAKLMGMGEPFFHPEYAKICELFKSTFPKATVISSTNCQYKLTKNFSEALKYIDILYLSIDGYNETYEKYRKPGKWYKLINFLDDLNKIDRQNTKIVINYVVNPNNILDIQKVHDEILIPYKLEKLRLNLSQNWSENGSIISEYRPEQIKYLKEVWNGNIMGKSEWDFKDCFWPKNGMYVTVNGNVKMCCMCTDAKPFGNIFESTIEEIKGRKEYQEIKLGCEINSPTNHCKNCSYKELVPLLKTIKHD